MEQLMCDQHGSNNVLPAGDHSPCNEAAMTAVMPPDRRMALNRLARLRVAGLVRLAIRVENAPDGLVPALRQLEYSLGDLIRGEEPDFNVLYTDLSEYIADCRDGALRNILDAALTTVMAVGFRHWDQYTLARNYAAAAAESDSAGGKSRWLAWEADVLAGLHQA